MTTNHRLSDYNSHRSSRNRRIDYYSRTSPTDTGLVTNRSKTGPYTVTEKDFGDHKVLYYIPSNYENDYDLSQLDERPFYRDPRKRSLSPTIRRRNHHSYDENDNDDDESSHRYIEELPQISPRRYRYVSPERTQYVRKVYYEPSPPSSIIKEYIYEEDRKPKREEIIEYIIEEPPPKPRYVTELPPIHRETLPPPRTVRSPHPATQTIRPLQLHNIISPHRSKLKQHTPRISPNCDSPRKLNSQNQNEQNRYPPLKEILAENRARRGSRIPIPRREIEEDKPQDSPIYNRNFVKNDFFVYK